MSDEFLIESKRKAMYFYRLEMIRTLFGVIQSQLRLSNTTDDQQEKYPFSEIVVENVPSLHKIPLMALLFTDLGQ